MLTTVLLAASMVVGQADKQELSKDWMKRLEGKWKTEWIVNGDVVGSNEHEYTSVAGGNGLLYKATSNEGHKGVGLVFYDPATESIVHVGCGAAGNVWRIEYSEIEKNIKKGMDPKLTGPDGKIAKSGTAVIELDGNKRIETYELTMMDGEKLSVKGVAVKHTP